MTSITTHMISIAVATLALAAPTAIAQPIDAPAGTSVNPGSVDRLPAQDLRNPDNRSVEDAPGDAYTQIRTATSARKVDQPAQDLRSPDTRDYAEGRGTFNAPEVTVVKLAQPAPPGDSGIDWADAGIGAGGMLGLTLLALGGTFAVVHRRQGARQVATTG